MATLSYTINWTDDTLKSPFTLNGQQIDTTSTSLSLTGKGTINWGESVQENLLHLLENFASNGVAPSHPTKGQVWFNAQDNYLKFYNAGNQWTDLAKRRIDSLTAPPGQHYPGDLWYDTSVDKLKVYNNAGQWVIQSVTVNVPAPTPVPTPTVPTPTPVTPTPITPTPVPTPVTPTPVSPTPTPIVPSPVVPTPTVIGPYGQNAANYTLIFQDEFNGTSLDFSKWNDHIWYESSDSVINYGVSNGSLKIWPSTGFVNRTIDTDGKFYTTYGFFEMDAKLPRGQGPWPAFWLFNHDNNPDFQPEVDIMEAYPGGGVSGGWGDSSLNANNYAVTVWSGPAGALAGTKKISESSIGYVSDLSTAFHKYAMKWEPNKMSFYFDGILWNTINVTMSNRMYLLLDLWFGSASGTPNGTTPTGPGNSFEVRYVRVWSINGTVPTAPTPIPTPTSPTPTPTAPTPTPAPVGLQPYGQSGSWTLTFNEDFNGTSLNTTKWNDHNWYSISDPTINYSVAGDGSLRIWPAAGFVNRSINTDGKFSQQYGYFEAEIGLPEGKGPRPWFGLINHDVGAALITVMEAYPGAGADSGWSDDQLRSVDFASVIYPAPGDTAATDIRISETNIGRVSDLSLTFHKYAVKWSANSITFYFDGVQYYTYNISVPQSMFINLELDFGSASGTPDGSTPTGPTNSMEIRYVRAWQFA